MNDTSNHHAADEGEVKMSRKFSIDSFNGSFRVRSGGYRSSTQSSAPIAMVLELLPLLSGEELRQVCDAATDEALTPATDPQEAR